MTFNRDMYNRGTNMSSIKSEQEKADKNDKRLMGNSQYAGFHIIEEGANTYRILPAHNPDHSPYIAIRTANLPCMVDEYDDEGQKTGKKVRKSKKVFISTQHGPLNDIGVPAVKNDVVEAYIEFVNRKAKELFSSEKERVKYLQYIRGYREDGKWVWGIIPQSKVACYALNSNLDIKVLELSKNWWQDMERMSFEASNDGVAAVDIFSHVDNGVPLVITKEIKKEKGKSNKTEYHISKGEPNMMARESWDDFFNRTRVDDAQLSELHEKKSLKELYSNNYTQEDFAMVVEALQYFDKEKGYNVFDEKDWIDIFNAIESDVRKFIKEKEKDSEDTDSEEKDVDQKEEKAAVTKTTVPKMRKFINEYIAENYGPEVKMPVLKRDDLEKWYNLAVSGDELPFPESENEEGDLPWEVDDKKLDAEMESLKNDE